MLRISYKKRISFFSRKFKTWVLVDLLGLLIGSCIVEGDVEIVDLTHIYFERFDAEINLVIAWTIIEANLERVCLALLALCFRLKLCICSVLLFVLIFFLFWFLHYLFLHQLQLAKFELFAILLVLILLFIFCFFMLDIFFQALYGFLLFDIVDGV